jgi:hypothetical protein
LAARLGAPCRASWDIATAPRPEHVSREAESQARWLRSICAELAFMDCPGAQAVVNASIGAWQLVVAHRECGG